MSDDKGAGDGPFSSEPLTETSTIVCKCYSGEISTYGWVFCCLDGAYAAKLANSAFEEGRKAERERLIAIVKAVMCVEDDLLNGIGKGIVETIKRGGQDAE